MTNKAQSALLIGATGAVGKHLLKELLNSSQFTRVGEFGRRTTALDTADLAHTDKLVQRTIDFEHPAAEPAFTSQPWDVVFITLGTTRKQAGGMDNFIKIDQDYVVNAAQAAKLQNHPQRLVYLSSGGADRNSRFPYLKSKGQTEDRLAALGYADTIIFQPGMLLKAERSESRFVEGVLQRLVSPLTALTTSLGIEVQPLAKSLRIAGEVGSPGLPQAAEATVAGLDGSKFTLVGNRGSIKLAETQ